MISLLPEKTCKVLKAIIQYKQTHDGISPSFADLETLTGMGRSNLHQRLGGLVRAELLRKTPGTSRNLAVVGGEWVWGKTRPYPPGRPADVLHMIITYKSTHDGNAPGHRDIADALGLAYAGSIKAYLDTLATAGFITTAYASDRHIEVVGGVWSHDAQLIEVRCPAEPSQKSLFDLH